MQNPDRLNLGFFAEIDDTCARGNIWLAVGKKLYLPSASATGERKRATCDREFRINGGVHSQNLVRDPTGICPIRLSPFLRIKLQDSSVSFMNTGFSLCGCSIHWRSSFQRFILRYPFASFGPYASLTPASSSAAHSCLHLPNRTEEIIRRVN